MDPFTCFLSAALIILGLVYIVKRAIKRLRFIALVDAIPGPRPYPLVGNVLDIVVPRNELMKAFNKRVEMNPPFFRVWIGPIAEVHLTRPEHIEVILNSMKHLEKSHMYKMLEPWLGAGLLTSKGSKWHSHRKMITPTFHFKILDVFVDIFVEKSEILVKNIKSQVGGKGFNIYPYITLCAMDIICETAMGIQIHAQADSKSDYVTAVYDISELTMMRGMRPWLHPDIIFNMTSMGKKFNKSINIVHDFTNKVIQERKVLREEDKEKFNVHFDEEDSLLGKKKKLAFLDLLLEASVNGNKLTDLEIREEVDTFMFEGHDTTTAGISWAIFLLGSHPDVQDKAYEELEEIFQDSDRSITMRDLQQMKYLERVIKETLRLYPSVPFIGRTLNEDVQIGEYLVPAGCKVSVHIYHCHRNKDQYPDPEKFNPDNFLPENVQARHPYAYIPFSAGPRNCIGQKFALLEEKTVLASILRKYKIESLEKRETLTLMSELILRPESGINVILTPRQSSY